MAKGSSKRYNPNSQSTKIIDNEKTNICSLPFLLLLLFLLIGIPMIDKNLKEKASDEAIEIWVEPKLEIALQEQA